MTHEIFQEGIFFHRKINALSSAGDFPSGGVEDEVVDLERPGRFGRAASQEGSGRGQNNSSMANGLVR